MKEKTQEQLALWRRGPLKEPGSLLGHGEHPVALVAVGGLLALGALFSSLGGYILGLLFSALLMAAVGAFGLVALLVLFKSLAVAAATVAETRAPAVPELAQRRSIMMQGPRLAGPVSLVLVSAAAVVTAVVLAAMAGWTIAVVPGLTYLLALGAAYLVYRQARRERAATMEAATALEGKGQPAGVPTLAGPPIGAMAFRVVGARGTCTLGHRVGEVVYMGPGGEPSPALCPYGAAVLRLAAADGSSQEIYEWCCPVYDHLLIFRREAVTSTPVSASEP